MPDLIDKVAEAINSHDPCRIEAHAAAAVLFKELSTLPIDEASWLSIVRFANENGVSLDG